MPTRKNAIIQVRKDIKRTVHNRAVKSLLKTARKRFEEILKEKDTEKVRLAYQNISSLLDKTSKKGVIHSGKANRLKSRYSLKMNKLAPSNTGRFGSAERTSLK
jgi:small subunit ribosomal protein S20